jgi:hypothetical protein
MQSAPSHLFTLWGILIFFPYLRLDISSGLSSRFSEYIAIHILPVFAKWLSFSWSTFLHFQSSVEDSCVRSVISRLFEFAWFDVMALSMEHNEHYHYCAIRWAMNSVFNRKYVIFWTRPDGRILCKTARHVKQRKFYNMFIVRQMYTFIHY